MKASVIHRGQCIHRRSNDVILERAMQGPYIRIIANDGWLEPESSYHRLLIMAAFVTMHNFPPYSKCDMANGGEIAIVNTMKPPGSIPTECMIPIDASSPGNIKIVIDGKEY